MYKYWILWTYISNFSSKANGTPFPVEVEADSPREAVKMLCSWYGDDFRDKAHFVVMITKPEIMDAGGQRV